MLVAEADGVIFIENPASGGCPDTRFRNYLDCKSCHTKKQAIFRTGAMCNKGCGVDLGIGPHLLGTKKEYMILKMYTCKACGPERKCAVEGCDKYPRNGSGGHCMEHAMQEQKDSFNANAKKKAKRCAVEGCDKYPQNGCGGHCMEHATQEQKDKLSRKHKK